MRAYGQSKLANLLMASNWPHATRLGWNLTARQVGSGTFAAAHSATAAGDAGGVAAGLGSVGHAVARARSVVRHHETAATRLAALRRR